MIVLPILTSCVVSAGTIAAFSFAGFRGSLSAYRRHGGNRIRKSARPRHMLAYYAGGNISRTARVRRPWPPNVDRLWQRSSSERCSAEPAPLFRAVPPALYPLHPGLNEEEAKRIECRTMNDEGRPACEIHRDESGDIFVLVGGTKIAKRGLPDTPQANTWIILEPGWFVRDVKGGKAIEVSYEHTRMH
jgi:hypothetical protein